jgi:integrase
LRPGPACLIGHRNPTRSILVTSEKAGLDAVGFHVLRHGFASTLIVDLGLDPVQVSRQLGHAQPSNIDRYVHRFDRAGHGETRANGYPHPASQRPSPADPDETLTNRSSAPGSNR